MLQSTVNGEKSFEIEKNNGQWLINNKASQNDVLNLPDGMLSFIQNNKSYTAVIEHINILDKEVQLNIDGHSFHIQINEPIDQLLSSMGLDLKAVKKLESVKAPMPGMVLKILVEPGQTIEKGDGLLILEAMKMENVLKASGTAKVKSIPVSPQTAVEKGTVLIELE